MADISQIKLPNGDTFDLIDEKSGYITAQYIENKTDYAIPVSRVGEIVVGETVIGTDSTNFPTSKAVVDYVDERVVQEMAAIDVGVESVNGKTGSVTLSASDVGAATQSWVENELDNLSFPDTKVTQQVLSSSDSNYYPILLGIGLNSSGANEAKKDSSFNYQASTSTLTVHQVNLNSSGSTLGRIRFGNITLVPSVSGTYTITLPSTAGTLALTSDIPQVYSSTNTGGYLTMATLPKYDGTVV